MVFSLVVLMFSCAEGRLVGMSKHASQRTQTLSTDLVDITAQFTHSHLTERGYKCCCDKHKSAMDTVRSGLFQEAFQLLYGCEDKEMRQRNRKG